MTKEEITNKHSDQLIICNLSEYVYDHLAVSLYMNKMLKN